MNEVTWHLAPWWRARGCSVPFEAQRANHGRQPPNQLKQRTLFTSRLERQLLQLRAHRRQRDANSPRDPRRAAFARGAKHTHLWIGQAVQLRQACQRELRNCTISKVRQPPRPTARAAATG